MLIEFRIMYLNYYFVYNQMIHSILGLHQIMYNNEGDFLEYKKQDKEIDYDGNIYIIY